MELLTSENWELFVLLAMPGFISLKAYARIHPVEDKPFSDSVLEAVVFGLFNAIILSPLVGMLDKQEWYEGDWFFQYIWQLLAFIIFPITWAWLLNLGLSKVADNKWTLSRHRTSWDHFFSRKEPCWVKVYLNDDTQVLGWFGENSYASSFPASGHLYVEEVWAIDDDGTPLSIPATRGMIFRPDDYKFVELFDPAPEADENE